jgi:predicted nucleic acid-binding Zn ribbon protein
MKKSLIVGLILASLWLMPSVIAIGQYVCADENTSYWVATVFVNGTAIPISYTDICNGGCSEVSGQCNPLQYEANVYNLLFIIAIVVGIVLVYKFTRGR